MTEWLPICFQKLSKQWKNGKTLEELPPEEVYRRIL